MYLSNEELAELLKDKITKFKRTNKKETVTEMLEILNLNDQINKQKQNRKIPLPKWNDVYLFPKVSQIRNWIQLNWHNFDDEVAERIGKNIYINEQNFFKWQEKHAS